MDWNTETDWPGIEKSYGFPDVDFDTNIASLSQPHTEDTLELFSTSLEPSFSTSGHSSPLYGFQEINGLMIPDVGLELETDYERLNNMQQPNYGCRTTQQLMSSQTPSISYPAMERDLNKMFSDYLPMLAGDNYNTEKDKSTLTPEKLSLSDLETSIADLGYLPMLPSPTILIGLDDVLPWEIPLPEQDSTDSRSQDIVAHNIVEFIAPKDNDVMLAVPTTLPIPTEKRRKGRPRKEQPKPIVEPEHPQLKPYLSPTVLPERNCKTACLQKIQSFLTESLDLEVLERECSGTGSRKRPRKVTRKFEKDPDYKDVDHSANTLLLTDTHISQDVQQKKRKMNNDASKRSRDKRKRREEQKERECKQLEARCKYLQASLAKLETVYYRVRNASLAC